MTTHVDAAPSAPTAIRVHPPMTPLEPNHPAPARFGAAGISAGDRIKSTISPGAGWSRRPVPNRIARGLGWFSIALGVTEVFGGDCIARAMGVSEHGPLIEAYGVREIATGIGLLSADTPKNHQRWMQARVAGDMMDLLTLGDALLRPTAKPVNVGGALVAVAAVTAVDLLCLALLSDG